MRIQVHRQTTPLRTDHGLCIMIELERDVTPCLVESVFEDVNIFRIDDFPWQVVSDTYTSIVESICFEPSRTVLRSSMVQLEVTARSCVGLK